MSQKSLTKNDLLDVLAEFYADMIKPEFESLGNRLETKIDNTKIELQGQIDSLKWDTPTKKEFNDLKSKVDRHHPTN